MNWCNSRRNAHQVSYTLTERWLSFIFISLCCCRLTIHMHRCSHCLQLTAAKISLPFLLSSTIFLVSRMKRRHVHEKIINPADGCDHSNSMAKPRRKKNLIKCIQFTQSILFKWKCITFGANLFPFDMCCIRFSIADAQVDKISELNAYVIDESEM